MKKSKIFKAIIWILFILISIIIFSLFSYILIKYKGFASTYRILIILITAYLYIFLLHYFRRSVNKKGFSSFIILLLLTIILNIGCSYGYYYLNKIYDTINNYSTNNNMYSSSLVTYNLNLKDYKDLNNNKIGLIKDTSETHDIEGNILPLEIIDKLKLESKNKIVYYDTTIELLHDLSNKKIDAAFFSSNYIDMFSSLEGYEEIENKTKTLYTFEKEYIVNEGDKTKTSTFSKPFNMLLIGVDSSKDGVTSGYNADVLLLVSFNPKTLNATLTSVPRDMYLVTACSNGKYRRINTTTWGSSSSCAVQTIENLFDVDIDYYAKINFKGIVNLVESVGGIDADVPYSFCEQNSSRQWGKNTVFVEKGKQHLNGEQALALARNRHSPGDSKGMRTYCPTYTEGPRNDYVRGKNQMKVIMGIVKAATKLRNPDQAIDILENISANFQTNIKTNDVLSLYDLGKSLLVSNGTNLINIKRLQLSGKNVYGKVYDELSKNYPAVTIPYKESIDAIRSEIKIVLGKSKDKPIKTISFDLNNPFKDKVVGDGNFSNIGVTMLKDLSKMSFNEIINYANNNNLILNILDYNTSSKVSIDSLNDYTFVKQKEHKDTIVNQLKSITIYVKNKSITATTGV